MRRHLHILILLSLVFATIFANNPNAISDTLSYFVSNPGAASTVNGNTGSRGLVSVDIKGNQYFIALTPVPVSAVQTPIVVQQIQTPNTVQSIQTPVTDKCIAFHYDLS